MPRKQTLTALATLAIGVAAATSAHAACLSDVQVAEMAEHYAARTPAGPVLTPADVACRMRMVPARGPSSTACWRRRWARSLATRRA